jgi:hypothetical protein
MSPSTVRYLNSHMKLTELKQVRQHFDPQQHRTEVENKLHDAGFHVLGSGASATVWHIPGKPYVLKMFDTEDQAYLDFVHMAKQSNFNPHFPMFRGAPVKLTSEVSVIRMERLKPLTINWASSLQRGIRTLMELIEGGSDWQDELSDYSAQERRDVANVLKKWPRLLEAIHMMQQLYIQSDHAHWDLHGDNVMLRGTVPVFTDPFAM